MTLAALEIAIRSAWSAETCDPADVSWSPANPSRGQCGVTSLVLHDFLGGTLVLSDVYEDGAKVGHHYWLRTAGGLEIDLTRDQFRPTETLSNVREVVRPDGPPGRCREQYELLRERVRGTMRV